MIGVVTAAANEINYSETVSQQVQHVPVQILALTAIIVYSSLTPILKGAKSEAFGKATLLLCCATSVRIDAFYADVLFTLDLPLYRYLHTKGRDHKCTSSHARFCMSAVPGELFSCAIFLRREDCRGCCFLQWVCQNVALRLRLCTAVQYRRQEGCLLQNEPTQLAYTGPFFRCVWHFSQ